ncbi:hypothetical protein RDI58_029044 [Solanum bulbocastanum]|uniref:Uncharacterized protein n=1 Tax=Solanum bulbocastanum TaxID=147425 RepID=A0AAN8SVL6_SOLBU
MEDLVLALEMVRAMDWVKMAVVVVKIVVVVLVPEEYGAMVVVAIDPTICSNDYFSCVCYFTNGTYLSTSPITGASRGNLISQNL